MFVQHTENIVIPTTMLENWKTCNGKLLMTITYFDYPRDNVCPWGDTQTVQVTCSLTHSRSDPGLSCQCVSVFLHTIDPIKAPAWNSIQNQRSLWQHSDVTNVNFWVPQGSILVPVLFNIYVADFQQNLDVKCFQNADYSMILKWPC